AMLLEGDQIFVAPAYPLCRVVDPTGAGDAFAGGVYGYLARHGKSDFNALKKAVIYGSVMGSFTVESFSVDRLAELKDADIQERYHAFVELTHFENGG
ncbi:MAG: sugar kinase, partial [Acidobacteria bacterium]|nr:sugar kinase [Acidobacteriota bacterium]